MCVVHVVREVVDEFEAMAHGVALSAVQKLKVNVVNRLTVFKAVDQIQRCATNALDGGQAQFHWPGRDLDRLRTQLKSARISLVRVFDAKRHAARRRPVLGRKVGGGAVRLLVDDEVDVALAVQQHVFGPVFGDEAKAHGLEHGAERGRIGGGKFNKLETTQPHGVVK